MDAGESNQRVTIQAATIAYGDYNQPIETWTDLFTDWAKIMTTGGGEFYAAQKVNAQTTALFDMRFTRRITSRNRIKHGNRIYEILGEPNDVNAAHERILISCKAVS